MSALIPVGPGLPPGMAAILKSHEQAIRDLQAPGAPSRLASVALKAGLPDPALWPECALLCDEINSIVVSTLVTGAYAWLRADGSTL